jgi:CSLREA domain-containing protein
MNTNLIRKYRHIRCLSFKETRNNLLGSAIAIRRRGMWISHILILLAFLAQASCGGATSVEPQTSKEAPSDGLPKKESPLLNTNHIPVTTENDLVSDDDLCSLREAILAANQNKKINPKEHECPKGSDKLVDSIILIDKQTYKLGIFGANEENGRTGDLDIIDDHDPLAQVDKTPVDVILVPLDQDQEIGNAEIVNAADDRELHILSEANASIWNITFRNGAGADDGGGIRNDGTLALYSVIISNNKANKNGGGVYSSGKLIIGEDSIIGEANAGNAAVMGGGIYVAAGLASVSKTKITGNAAVDGGGIFLDNGTMTMSSSAVGGMSVEEGNAASDNGGGINNAGGSLAIQENCFIGFNIAAADGGGIYNSGTLNISDSTIGRANAGNKAASGGGISNHNGILDITGSAIGANSAENGGGINNSGSLTITDSMIGGEGAGNAASKNGGGIFNSSGTLTIQDNSIISANTATADGGGVYNSGTINLSESMIGGANAGNTARSGGGIENRGTLDIQDGTISANSAVSGGGIGNSGALTIAYSTIGGEGIGNTASTVGGGIANTGHVGTVTATATKFLDNTATDEGGAVYHAVNITNSVNVTGSCFVNNSDTAVFNGSYESQNVTGNWWGKPNGPYEAGNGLGDSISINLDFGEYLAVPTLECPMREIRLHVIHILWFCWEGNSTCDQFRNEIFPDLEEKYLGQLMVLEIDLYPTTGPSTSGFALYEEAGKYYGVEDPLQLPFICLGEKYLMAPFDVSKLEDRIIEGLSDGGIDWPAIPGFQPPEEE